VTVRGDVVVVPAWVFWREKWFTQGAGLDPRTDDIFTTVSRLASEQRRPDLTPKPGRTFEPRPPDFRLR
jgi:hypothetical protein